MTRIHIAHKFELLTKNERDNLRISFGEDPVICGTTYLAAGCEDFVHNVAHDQGSPNVLGISRLAAKISSDKLEQYSYLTSNEFGFDESIVRLPKYTLVADISSSSFTSTFDCKCVLKPINNSSSKFVRLFENGNLALEYFKNNAENYRASRSSSKGIIQKHIDGDTFSVDAILLNRKIASIYPAVRTISSYEVGFPDFGHVARTSNYSIASEYRLTIIEYISHIADKLSIEFSYIHVEFILSDTGLYVLEFSLRPGGYRDTLYSLAFGRNIWKDARDAIDSQGIEKDKTNIDLIKEFTRPPERNVALITPIPRYRLEFRGLKIKDIDLSSVEMNITCFTNYGLEIGPASMGFSKSCLIVLSSKERDIQPLVVNLCEDHLFL